VRVEAWTLEQHPEGVLVGLFDQSCRRPRPAPKGETRAQRLSRPRKPQTWAAGLQSAGRPPAGSQWIYVADRESDFYEPMQRCQKHGVDFVIRSAQKRRLAEEAGQLQTVLATAPVLGQSTVALRARAGQSARPARVELRSVRVTWRPGGWQEPLRDIGVIEVREVEAPAGIKAPLCWILLTSLPVATLAEVQRVVGRYTARWWIEEYHKALKSGASICRPSHGKFSSADITASPRLHQIASGALNQILALVWSFFPRHMPRKIVSGVLRTNCKLCVETVPTPCAPFGFKIARRARSGAPYPAPSEIKTLCLTELSTLNRFSHSLFGEI
jgi:hypothetical protein